MRRRTLSATTLSAVLALGGTGSVALAQDVSEPGDAAATASTTGMLEVVVDEDGRTTWFLNVDGELIELHFGPSWFSDLTALFGVEAGAEVEIEGNVRHTGPNEHASDVAQEKAAKAPKLKIKKVNGESRPKGKPVWAGGPKVQGDSHPGAGGWSKGQAKKDPEAGAAIAPAAGKANKPEHAKGK